MPGGQGRRWIFPPYRPGAVAPSAPVSGIYRIYADGDNGDDANSGVGGWANAVLTPARAEKLARNALLQQPLDTQVVLFLRGAFSGSFTLNMPTVGGSRFHVVHPVFESVGGPPIWTPITSGTIAAASAPGYQHGNVLLSVSNVTDVQAGHFIRLRDSTGTKDILYQILKAWDDAGSWIIISAPNGVSDLPSWVDATATFEVYTPSMDCTEFLRDASATLHGDDISNEYNPKNLVFGIRASRMFIMGRDVAVGGCVVPGSLYFRSVVGGACCWQCDTSDDGPWVSPALMAEFGLGNWYSYVAADEEQYVGNTVGTLYLGASEHVKDVAAINPVRAAAVVSGLIYGELAQVELKASRIGPCVITSAGGHIWVTSSLVGGALPGSPTFQADPESEIRANTITFDLPADVTIGPSWIAETFKGYVAADAGTIDAYTSMTSDQYPFGGFHATLGGVIKVTSAPTENLPVQDRLALSDPESLIDFTVGPVTMPSYSGIYPDIEADGGTVLLNGDINKLAANNAPSPLTRQNNGGRIVQNANRALNLPVTANTYQADYGTEGPFYSHDGCFTRLGSLAGGSGGGGQALTLKRASNMTYTACALGGAPTVVVGANVPAAWAPAVDAVAELCALMLNAAP